MPPPLLAPRHHRHPSRAVNARRRRPVGIDRGMTLPDDFFEPLPGDLLAAFEGGGEAT